MGSVGVLYWIFSRFNRGRKGPIAHSGSRQAQLSGPILDTARMYEAEGGGGRQQNVRLEPDFLDQIVIQPKEDEQ